MKLKYPLVTLSEQLETVGDNVIKKITDVKVKLTPHSTSVHYNFPTMEEAKKFCKERFGGWRNVFKDI